jgi:hypothetical protein
MPIKKISAKDKLKKMTKAQKHQYLSCYWYFTDDKKVKIFNDKDLNEETRTLDMEHVNSRKGQGKKGSIFVVNGYELPTKNYVAGHSSYSWDEQLPSVSPEEFSSLRGMLFLDSN